MTSLSQLCRPFCPLLAAVGLFGGLDFSMPAVRAEDSIRVDIVVNTTDAGNKLPRVSPEHPAYYFPWTAGYLELGAILHAQNPPPPTVEIQHQIAVALAKRGYLLGRKAHPPSIVLVLWWGYLAPVLDHPWGDYAGGSAFNGPGGLFTMAGVGISAGVKGTDGVAGGVSSSATAAQAMGPGAKMPGYSITMAPNDHQMFLMLAGDTFEEDIGRVSHSTDELHESAHHPRYFLMVSALDFQAAIKRKPVLLWCARVSTEMANRNLGDVLPTLIEAGVPRFGEDTGGPKFENASRVPMGRVEVGVPVLKANAP